MEPELTREQIDYLEREAEKQDKVTYGMCPLVGLGGHICNPDCAWYIKGRGCAVAIIARDISGR